MLQAKKLLADAERHLHVSLLNHGNQQVPNSAARFAQRKYRAASFARIFRIKKSELVAALGFAIS